MADRDAGDHRTGQTMSTASTGIVRCTIKRCTHAATVLVVLDRSPSDAAHTDHAWTGHLETRYCAAHAVSRPSVKGLDEYGDTWTLKPIREGSDG